MRAETEPLQTTLDEAIPLSEVTFVVVDLETTGGSPSQAGITEIGAVAYRGGERVGTFETLVDPQLPIPPFVARLTGITDRMVAGAPTIGQVLPSFRSFARDAVIVAHNATFDVGFLDAALDAHDLPLLPAPAVCTARLARRVVWPDVPNVKLRTLAEYFRTPTQPRHRAFGDAQATAEVLHGLLELGGRLGIRTLGELHAAVRARGRPNYGKIRLADDLPRTPGVYLFRGRDDAVLYVGKSKDLRTRVRSYFYGDSRRKVGRLLEQVTGVEGRPCGSELEALVLEARLIREHEPTYNRHGKGWRRYTYLKLDLAEAFPRLKVVREVKGDGVFLGPFASSSRAALAKEALEEAFPVRRCTRAMGATTRFSPCALAGIGRCPAPCDGRVDRDGYAAIVDAMRDALAAPGGLLAVLEDRMRSLAEAERFEEAAAARTRGSSVDGCSCATRRAGRSSSRAGASRAARRCPRPVRGIAPTSSRRSARSSRADPRPSWTRTPRPASRSPVARNSTGSCGSSARWPTTATAPRGAATRSGAHAVAQATGRSIATTSASRCHEVRSSSVREAYFSRRSCRARASFASSRSRIAAWARKSASPSRRPTVGCSRMLRTQSLRSPPPESRNTRSPSSANQISIVCGLPVRRPVVVT